MSEDVLEILAPGSGLTLQDAGRPGWKRFGLPPGGAMDRDSTARANQLVGNDVPAPVLEVLFSGAKLRALRPVMLGLARVDGGEAFFLEAGREIDFGPLRAGVWSYLAIAGGFACERWFGSASVNARAGLGAPLRAGSRLSGAAFDPALAFAAKVEEPTQASGEIPVFRGPEWNLLGPKIQEAFLAATWTVSPQSDRAGYRLEAPDFPNHPHSIASAPMAVGVVQLPPGGQPIVLLRDGPTVGGYPRLVILEPAAISRFTQCAPGAPVRFRLS